MSKTAQTGNPASRYRGAAIILYAFVFLLLPWWSSLGYIGLLGLILILLSVLTWETKGGVIACSWATGVTLLTAYLTDVNWTQFAVTIVAYWVFGLTLSLGLRHLRRTNRALLEYKTAVQQAVDGVALGHMDGSIRFVNQAWADMHGFTVKDLVGQHLSIFHSPEQLRNEVEPFTEVMLRTGANAGEVSHVRKDGTDFLTWMTTTVLRDEQGQPFGLLAIARDITEQKGMEVTLRESEEKLRQIAETMGEVFWLRSADNKEMLYINPAYETVWGRTCSSLYENPESFLETVYDEDKPAVFAAFAEYAQTGEFSLEYRIVRPSGEIRWIHARTFPVRDEQGAIIRHTGLAVDITDRKQSERAYRESEARFRALYENSPVAITIHDAATGSVLDANDTALLSYGCSSLDELVAHDPWLEPPYSQADALVWIRRVAEEGPQVFEWKSKKLTGEEFWEQTRLVPVTLDGTVRVLTTSMDITERKQAAENIEYLSFHDVLTGLYNRRFYEEELRRFDIPRNLPLTLLMVDVNGLKLTNDAFGHAAGDTLLRKTAVALQETFREKDIVARVGGDEFAVLLPNTDGKQAPELIRRVHLALRQETVEGLPLSVSCGWAVKMKSAQNLHEVFREAENHMYRRKAAEQRNYRYQTIQLIVQMLYNRSQNEKRHAKRVSRLCGEMGAAMGLNQSEIDQLKTVGELHDIGKISVGHEILEKRDPLSDTEWEQIKRHPQAGHSILSAVNEYGPMAESVLAHHERWDGTGYPNRRKAEEVPKAARIIAVAEAYDVMTTKPPYGKGMSCKDAIAEIEACAGSQFDPAVAQIFAGIVGQRHWVGSSDVDEEALVTRKQEGITRSRCSG